MEQQIKNVVFDVGNVLIDFCWKKTCEILSFSPEIVDAFEKYMVMSDIWGQLDEGIISQKDAIDYFIRRMPESILRRGSDTGTATPRRPAGTTGACGSRQPLA